ncbi:MAG: glycosyl hydrolase, partial [Gemmatimonadales bacterium]
RSFAAKRPETTRPDTLRRRPDSLSIAAGHHRFRWDMRYPGPRDFKGLIFWGANTQGPLAPPGRYQARLTVHGRSFTEPFEIVKDPRLTEITQADFDAQFRLSSNIARRVDDAHRAVIQVRSVREQVDDRLKKSNDPNLARLAAQFRTGIGAVEEEVYQVRMQARQDPLNYPIRLNNQIAALRGVVESADARPTDQAAEAFQFLSGELTARLDRLRVLFTEDLGRLNDQLRRLKLEPIVVPDRQDPRLTS